MNDPGYKHMPYENRLTQLDLLTLRQRQLQGDLIEVFKIIIRYDDVRGGLHVGNRCIRRRWKVI